MKTPGTIRASPATMNAVVVVNCGQKANMFFLASNVKTFQNIDTKVEIIAWTTTACTVPSVY